MSLDQNLFTLNVTQRPDDRNVVDLIDPRGVVYYTKRRIPGTEYKVEVYDPLSESLLATVCAPSPTSKHKTLQLHNPDIIVELKYTGTISFKWGFKWEDHDFEWKREECYILRKPDPSVLVAVTKEPPGRLQTRAVQLLDYNLNRFDINDRKGLEIVILTALLTFQDSNETYHAPREGSSSAGGPTATPPVRTDASGPPPTVPPRPEPRQGAERVAEMHAVRTAQGEGEANEIEVGEECTIIDYARYADRLLNDEAMLFISIRSASAVQVPKVLRVVEETKRLRHKSGIAEDEELHQYVIYDTDKPTRKGPKRINLDDPDPKKAKDKYAPPTSLTVHLSKIPMPELQPKATPETMRRSSGSGRGSTSERPPPPVPAPVQEMSDKERRRMEKNAKEEGRRAEKETKKSKKDKNSASPAPHKLSKPGSSAEQATSTYHAPAHQVHPFQPSPSPSQLNNPSVYTAPPPRARPVSMAFPTPSYYGSGAGSGYNAMPSPSPPMNTRPSPNQSGHLSTSQESGRPSSFYQSSSGKGPVSALLDMWSKH